MNENGKENYVDLVCNSSHFVRMRVDKNDNGQQILGMADDSKAIEDFIRIQKPIYSIMSDKDKEFFENYIGFISIKHSFGSAISLRNLLENFLKNNFIEPALEKFLPEEQKGQLFNYVRKYGGEYLSRALHLITFSGLVKLLKTRNVGRNGNRLRKKIRESIVKYVEENDMANLNHLGEEELDKIQKIFDLVSKVIHGSKYDTDQIFSESKPFFDVLTGFNQMGTSDISELGD